MNACIWQTAKKYFLMESGLALVIAFLINVAVVSVSGSVCSNPNISSDTKKYCQNITLESAAFLLKVQNFLNCLWVFLLKKSHCVN